MAAQGYIGRAPGESSVVVARQTFTPTGITTNFTFASGYTIGYVDAYLNGARLIEGDDYTATDGSVVGLTTHAINGDVLELVVYKAFNLANVTGANGDFIVPDKIIHTNDTDTAIRFPQADTFTVETGGSEVFRVDANGNVGIGTTNTLRIADPKNQSGINVGFITANSITAAAGSFGSLNVSGTLSYEDVANQDVVGFSTFQKGIVVQGAGSTTTTLNVTGVTTITGNLNLNANLDLQDNDKILIGTGDDLEIYHDGTDNFIKSNNALKIQAAGSNSYTVHVSARTDKETIKCYNNTNAPYVELFYDNSKKFETTGGGVIITGIATATGLKSNDTLTVSGVTNLNNDVIFDGASYDASWDKSANTFNFQDNAKATFGTGNDLQIYHDGTNNWFWAQNGPTIHESTSSWTVRSVANENYIVATENGAVELYYDGSKKLDTKSDGVNITGELECDTLDVDGATNIEGQFKLHTGVVDKARLSTDGVLYLGNNGNSNALTGTTPRVILNKNDDGSATFSGTVSDSKGDLRTIPQNSKSTAYTLVAADAGKHVLNTADVTVPASVFAAGVAITIINGSTGNINITQGSGTTIYYTADGTSGSRVLATRGMASMLFVNATDCYISGAGLS